jgi:hypothetical protein
MWMHVYILCSLILGGANVFIEFLLLSNLPCFIFAHVYMFVYIFACAYFIIAFGLLSKQVNK